jgi:hypothetical protein
MPPINDDDPLRMTEFEPNTSMPDRHQIDDFTQVSSDSNGATAATPPGQVTEPMDAEPDAAATSVSVPGYAIEELLGRGAMGVVYKARHLTLKRTVALKMVLAGGHAEPGELTRFRIEAESLARLQHPNIVQIHDVGEADGHPYCALEFVERGDPGGRDGQRRVWDVASGRVVGKTMAHPGEIRSLAFSPDGKSILTGCRDGVSRLWDTRTRQWVGPPLRQFGIVEKVNFAAVGRKFLTAGRDRSVRQWSLPSPAPGDVRQVREWVETITGCGLDQSDAVQVLKAEEWRERRAQAAQARSQDIPG